MKTALSIALAALLCTAFACKKKEETKTEPAPAADTAEVKTDGEEAEVKAGDTAVKTDAENAEVKAGGTEVKASAGADGVKAEIKVDGKTVIKAKAGEGDDDEDVEVTGEGVKAGGVKINKDGIEVPGM